MRRSESVAGRRWSTKILVGSTTLGVIALGTGIGLASTQNATKAADSVTCIVQVDAKAAADANSALSDVFGVGTKLHVSSAGRAVDVTVSAPLTAAAPPADNGQQNNNGQQKNDQKNNQAKKKNNNKAKKNKAKNNKAKKAKKAKKNKKGQARKNIAKATTTSARAVNTVKAVNSVKAVNVNAAAVDPNTVCVDLSKDAFNTLGDVVNGNNVGAFIATMTVTASNKGRNNAR